MKSLAICLFVFIASCAAAHTIPPPENPERDVESARVAFERGDLLAARTLAERALETAEKTLPDDHPDMQRARAALAVILRELGDLQGARALQEKVLAIRLRTLPSHHFELDRIRAELALTFRDLGDLPGARVLQEQVLESRSRTLPDDHPDLQSARGDLASTMRDCGDLQGARVLEQKVLEVDTRTLPEDHPELQAARENLAVTLQVLGRLQEARVLEEEVLEARVRSLPDDHPALQRARAELAVTSRGLGNLQEARGLQQHVLEIRARTLPSDHPDVARARTELAETLLELGDLHGARTLLEQALEIRSKTLPVDHPDVQASRAALVPVLLALGEAAAARPLAEKVAAVYADTLPQDHPARLRNLAALARVYAALGNESGLRAQLEHIAAAVQGMGAQLAVLSPREAGERVASMQPLMSTLVSLAPLVHQNAALEERLFAALATIQDALAARTGSRAQIDAKSLAAAIGPHACAVTYARYSRSIDPASRRLAETEANLLAFVVDARGVLSRVELGPEAAIEEVVAHWRMAIGRPLDREATTANTQVSEREAGEALRKLVLDPVLAVAGDATTLYVRPESALHLVSLDALPFDDNPGGELVGEHRAICVEHSFERLVAPPRKLDGASSLLALGGIDYDAQLDKNGKKGGDSRWNPLPATRAEVDAIARSFANAFRAQALVLTGTKATRAALAENARAARFVHIATHGWFAPESMNSWNDSEPRHKQSGPGMRLSGAEQVRGMSPMLMCGLALAGANSAADSEGRVQGILTAEELAGFDLSNCALAVLSASETNVGVMRAGQGVASLASALHAAGARASITSLWKIDDAHTRELMESFYKHWWTDKETAAQALWNAKMDLHKRNVPTRDWACWILIGDPD